MDITWLTTSWTTLLMVIISTLGIYITVILFTRIAGLRSFSKMSSFDFAMTVAVGSLVASTILSATPPLLQAVVALASIYLFQMAVSRLRRNTSFMSKIVDNEPLLLMRGTEILEDHLNEAKVTLDDLRAKLREANVTQLSQVQAVVMESTGDIAVLHHQDPDHKLDEELLKDVRGWNN